MKCAGAITVVASAALLMLSLLRASPAQEEARSIPVAELSRMQIIGWLGQPLGKICTVEGVVADEDYRRAKADLGHTLLRIQAVNGKKLTEECVFHFSPYLAKIEKPTVGGRFRYVGYETGGFTGTPAGVFDYIPAHCSTGYAFTTDFVVLRDELKQSNK